MILKGEVEEEYLNNLNIVTCYKLSEHQSNNLVILGKTKESESSFILILTSLILIVDQLFHDYLLIQEYIQMKDKLEELFSHQLSPNTLVYGVPLKWWQQLANSNHNPQAIDQIVFPKLNLRPYMDSFLFQFTSYLIEELEHKCNHLKFNRVYISPLPKENSDWTIVPSSVWARASQNNKDNQGIMVMYDQNNPVGWLSQEKTQIQLVFCSKYGSEAFIGYFPKTARLVEIIRGVGYELGFIQMENSRITYPDRVHDKPLHYQEIENLELGNAPDTLIMAFNLQKQNQEQDSKDFSFNKLDENINQSNEAVMGDLGIFSIQSWENRGNNDRTMSTGAETPTFLLSEEDNGQFRVKQLFRERIPQEIEQMKIYAQKCLTGQMIELPQAEKQDEMNKNLDKLAEEITELAGFHKKKISKDKELYHQK